jgi:hypothetical protein
MPAWSLPTALTGRSKEALAARYAAASAQARVNEGVAGG